MYKKSGFISLSVDRNGFAAELYRCAVIFLFGGFVYGAVEILYRGHTHPSMFVLGGICFLWVGGLDSIFRLRLSVPAQMMIGGAFITLSEFLFGVIFNIWLGMRVWDYSKFPLNIMGQVCPPFFAAWVLLSLPAIFLEDALRKNISEDGGRLFYGASDTVSEPNG